MTRTTTVSGIRPDKAGDGEWIDINGHVGRLMSTLMADGRPFSIDVTPGGMTTVTPSHPRGRGSGRRDAQAETEPADEDHQQEDAVRPVPRQAQGEPRRKKTIERNNHGTSKRNHRQDADHPRGILLSDLAAARVQAGIAAGESIERIMDGMTTMLQHPLALGFDRTSLLCGLGGACAVGLFHLYRWSMKRNWRDGEEYGSARWSTSREMAPYTDNDTRQNLQMTPPRA